MNAVLWIRDPYPFRFDEREAIQEALRRTYSHRIAYIHEWPIDYVCLDSTNITTCKQLALTLRAIHTQWAIQDKNNTGREYTLALKVEIREAGDGRPDWAREKAHETVQGAM